MTKAFLDTHFWKDEFAVTDGDLDRLEEMVQGANEPIWATELLRRVVERKIERSAGSLDPQARAISLEAAGQFLGDAVIYHPTKRYEIGQELFVARKLIDGSYQIGRGQVVNIDRSRREPVVEIQVPGEPDLWRFVCELPSQHRWARAHSTPLSGRECTPDEVLESFREDLFPHLQGRLAADPRFVNWGDLWWLTGAVPMVPTEILDQLQAFLLRLSSPLPTPDLLSQLNPNWPDTPSNRFALNRAMLTASDRFENLGTETDPQWQALLPAHVIRLADGTLFDPSLEPDELWAQHGALFQGPMPDELCGHPDVVQLYDRWLLRSLLVPFDTDDLEILCAYLEEACEARSDSDLLDLFDRGPQDDDWFRWRFSLAWALHKSGEKLGIEFVGAGGAWRWALRIAPVERPERHRPIPGKDGLPVQVVEVVAGEIERDLSDIEPDEPEPEPAAWEPAASEWQYTLTYYDWQHGILPYAGGARAVIPPLVEGQARALLYVAAPQVSEEPFAVTLRRHERTPWLQSEGLQELCQGFHLVPGARIRLLRTEQPDQFTLLYTPAAEQTSRVLMFGEGSLRPRIQEITFACEVDPDMLLAEGRFTDLEALDRLYRADRRTAPKVLADVFEAIGSYDPAEHVYRAPFRNLFPLLCVTKPYSLNYVRQILSRSRNFPWFYPDEEVGSEWYVYDCRLIPHREKTVRPKPRKKIPDLGKRDRELDKALHELESDPDQMRLLAEAMAQYHQLPGQAQMLVLRAHAHARIQRLLSQDALPDLTLEAFNQQVWQSGHFIMDGRPLKWTDTGFPSEICDLPTERLEEYLSSGRIQVTGNATWGSGAHIYGAPLKRSDANKLTLLKRTLDGLLYGSGSIEQRIAATDQESNGFGLNIITGILHALWPDRYSLFNSAAMKGIGQLLPAVSWKRDVRHYPKYQQACKWFMAQELLGFESLTDLDWFIYNISKDYVQLKWPDPHEPISVPAQDTDKASESDEPVSTTVKDQNEAPFIGETPQPTEGEFRQIQNLVLVSLVGQTIHTLTGKTNQIVQADDHKITVATGSGEDQIPWPWIEQVYQALRALGTIEVKDVRKGPHRTPGGYRSAFIFGLLAQVAHVEARTKPRIALTYHEPVGAIELREASEPGPEADATEALTAAEALAAAEAAADLPDLWKRMRALEGRELHTLAQRQPFTVQNVTVLVVRYTVAASGLSYQASRHNILKACLALRDRGQIAQEALRSELNLSMPVYIAALLNELPYVTHTTDPVTLQFLTAPSAPQQPEAAKDSSEKEEADTKDSPPPTERRRDGQMAMSNMPMGPIFDRQSDPTPASLEEPAPETELPQTPTLPPVAETPTPVPETPSPPHPEPPEPPSSSRRSQLSSRRPVGSDPSRAKTLFSNHYLETRLPGHPEWADDPTTAFEAVRVLWHKAREYGDRWNEAQTEEEFVKPVLEALGWAFCVQTKVGSKGRITRPDYTLFSSEQAKDEAQGFLGDDDPFYSRALAIAEAKYWGRPLSQKDATGRNTWKRGSNPSHQMVSYLVGTRVPWGILTNGRTWRLYSREVSSTASEFYEVDLDLLFDFLPEDDAPGPEQLDLFRRWWLFFRRDAFVRDARDRSFVQRVHEGSGAYAREISDKLKELVFQQVVPEIAGGFVAYRAQQLGIGAETEESLREIYAATLSLLYKLLFLLYAEARSLLPVDKAGYREQSLTALAGWAAEHIDRELPLSDTVYATPQYDGLLALFHRIDQGDASLGIPRYNGGLFNPGTTENRFLETHRLSDRAVARAVDILVRDAGEPVDYAYISVRNLGAIYEGLLENRLVVDRPEGFSETLRVSLVNDKGERKASGSYYTPDYIVEYIVQHTLEPVLDQRQAQFEAAMDHCAELRHQLQHTADTTTIRLLRAQLERAERDAREAYLGIKVCDPAMGSGHFLVNAVDHLTDGIIQRMQSYHDDHPKIEWEWNPIQTLIESVRGEILAEMESQGIALDPGRLDDTALLTRLVMKRCIYGVDLNPLAVELAKLSLWLHSFTIGAPLSFLDHHLRWGNSLIGSDVRTVEGAIQTTDSGQFALFSGPFAGLLDLTALMTEVAEQSDATLADVRLSAQVFAQFQRELTPYKQVLDLWVSQYFGNQHAREFLTLYGDDVLPALKGREKVAPQYQAAIEQARVLWRAKRFFHWDLEFPDVFVDLHKRNWAESPGFDAVIGNPPYVRQEQLTPNKPWFQAGFAVYHGSADLYAYFYERGIRLLRQDGRVGIITSDKFIKASYGEPLRRFLTQEADLDNLVDFGHAPVFEDVDAFPCISVLRKPQPGATGEIQAKVCAFPREMLGQVDLNSYLNEHGFKKPMSRFGAEPWSLEPPEVDELMLKIRQAGVPLREFAGQKPYRGILTGLNQAFLIDTRARERLIAEDPNCGDIIRPYLRGQDIKRWTPQWAGLWMILLKSSENQVWPWSEAGDEAERLFAKTYPSLHRHLKPFETRLRKRWDKGRFWWELRSCIYYEVFDKPKISYQEIQFHPAFGLDMDGYLTNNKVFLLPCEDRYVLAVLNSPLIWWYNWRYLPHMKDEALSPKGELMDTLPIASPTDAIRAEVEPAVEQLIALTKEKRGTASSMLNWLRVEFGVEKLGRPLEAFATLDENAYIQEVSNRRPASVGHLAPADIGVLRKAYAEHAPAIRAAKAQSLKLERRVAELVNTAYGLTPEEIDLLWRTAPPRMPVGRPDRDGLG